ncbi:hypothetical protein BKA60DRAFT_468148, partial [Fusarium oxysporum]
LEELRLGAIKSVNKVCAITYRHVIRIHLVSGLGYASLASSCDTLYKDKTKSYSYNIFLYFYYINL